MTTHRTHNFNAGPGALPLPVLQKAKEELVDFRGTGMSLMEMSHRSATYESVHNAAIANLRTLMGISDDYGVLLMQGGARTHFALVAMNFLGGGYAEYVTTGSWSEIALEAARKVGEVRELWSSAESNHDHVPTPGDLQVSEGAAYVHVTSNNTIFGTQYAEFPSTGKVPLVCDMSSDILSRPIDVSRFGAIYAGAQKNMGPSGVTAVIVRRDLLERSPKSLHDMFSYREVESKNSLLNTPPVFAIYMLGLVLEHLVQSGGVAAMEALNRKKSELLYGAIDASGGFYKGHARPGSRSHMNVTFRLANESLEGPFAKQAEAAGLVGLKGHRSVGGLRASIYNAVPFESVQVLVEFMKDFAAKNG